jgi:general secretion pathway protein D
MMICGWKKNRYLVALPVLIGMLVLGGCATVPETSNFLNAGKELASIGDWDRSVQALQRALHENPEDKEARALLIRAKRNASLAHMNMGEAFLRENRFDEAITEFQMSIALDSSNTKAESLLEKARAMKESEYQVKRAENLAKTENPAQAKEALETALKLNPRNKKAEEMLASVREKAAPESPLRTKLDAVSPISLKFKDTPILNIFEALTKLTGVNFIFDRDLQDHKATIFVTDVAFDQFLEVFLRTNKLAHKIVNSKTIIIYPDTGEKGREYRDLQIRTFYLANLDTKKAVALLSKVLKSKDITPNETLNAVVIRGPKEMVDIASKVIEANDRPVSEIMMGVEILEVARTKELNLGVEYNPPSVSVGLGEPTEGFYNSDPESSSFRAMGNASLKALSKVSNQNILLALPTATINLLKQDGDTNILAKPQLRVKNGEKARIHIGERVPLRSNRRVETTGQVTTDFQYQDIGIKLEVEPIINPYDDITLKMILEVSALGANLGTAADPQFSVRTRTAQSVLNVRAGETVILGGLISDEERRTVRKVPFVGDIPVLGHLFKNRNDNDIKSDILMVITPIVIRSLDVPDPGVSRIWSGKEDRFSSEKPFESRLPAGAIGMPGVPPEKEDTGETLLEGAPGDGAPPPTPIEPLMPPPAEQTPLSRQTPPVAGADAVALKRSKQKIG